MEISGLSENFPWDQIHSLRKQAARDLQSTSRLTVAIAFLLSTLLEASHM